LATGFSGAAGTVHVIGAGVAGLAAAVALAARGRRVAVYEGAGHAGGRCRSFYDDTLGCRIDNGNHLLLSGNLATQKYLRQIGAEASLTGPDQADFPFMDLRTGERWSVKPDKGLIPWSLLSSDGRVPGTSLWEYLRGIALAWAPPGKTVSQCLKGNGQLFERFWEPLAVSVLNTEADKASAKLLWPVLRETFGRGAAACRPLIARQGLSESFVEPALAYLHKTKNTVAFNHRLKQMEFANGRLKALNFTGARIELTVQDHVILAVPPAIAGSLVPDLDVPDQFRAIVNGHFRLPTSSPKVAFIGLVGGCSHWLFVRNDMASVTVSAATELATQPSPDIALRLWPEICRALELGDCPMGPHRIVKEKRATFAQTPGQVLKRPDPSTAYDNLVLAGDWTNNGLPATIEGAIRSGQRAAELVVC